MPDKQSKIHHYRPHLKRYDEMTRELSDSDEYITSLIDKNGMNKIEHALRTRIEKAPTY